MGYVWTSEDSSGHKAISHMLFHAKFQVDGQFVFALIEKVTELSLQNFVHAMTAQLSWHVQNSVVTGWLETESQEKIISILFEFWAKYQWWDGAWGKLIDLERNIFLRKLEHHWNGKVFILMKCSSLAALEVVKMTTSSAASDENFVKMTTFLFQWCWWNQMSTWTAFRSHIRDKRITRSSHLYDGVPYIYKMASLKWNLHAGWQYKKQWNQHAFCIPKLTWLYQILNDVRS